MSTQTILLCALAAFFALAVSVYMYGYRSNLRPSLRWTFGVLRFLSLFTLLILLINPRMRSTTITIEKPDLIVLADDTESIGELDAGQEVGTVLEALLRNQELNGKFDVSTYSFGTSLRSFDSLAFEKRATDIGRALQEVGRVYRADRSAVLMLTDGNQTLGSDYEFVSRQLRMPLFPVVAGDTTRYADMAISRLNANRYAFLRNQFPVEVMMVYQGDAPARSRFRIRKGNEVVYQQEVAFDPVSNTQLVRVNIEADAVGIQRYVAEVIPMEGERNKANNSRQFAVEVIDQATNILIASTLVHPDIGLLKKSIASNQQRKVRVVKPAEALNELDECQLLVAYQPNSRFRELLAEARRLEINYLLVSGTGTDWSFLNAAQTDFEKEPSASDEVLDVVFNRNFGLYGVEDIGFEGFPPLRTSFGDLLVSPPHQVLLEARVDGIATGSPTLALLEDSGHRRGILDGEGLWRWRAQTFMDNGDFRAFDTFVGGLVQYLASTRQRRRLNVNSEAFYYNNNPVVISAQYFDNNYVFDPGAQLSITVRPKGSEGEMRQFPMLLRNNYFEADLSTLEEGEYNYSIDVRDQPVSASGAFTILDFGIERQFASANLAKLQRVADDTGGALFFPDQMEALISKLLSQDRLKPVQKSQTKIVPLIQWTYLLVLLAILLAAEWFIRKYNGLI